MSGIVKKQRDIEENYLDDLLHAEEDGQLLKSSDAIEVIKLTNEPANEVDADQFMMDAFEEESAEEVQDEVVGIEEFEQEDAHSLECKLIKVDGINMALPIANIANVIAWPGNVYLPADKHDCVVGLMAYKDMAIDLVPILLLIKPDEKDAATLESFKGEAKTIIILQDSEVGLICDEAEENIVLNKDDICWRGEESKRKWLAGTIKEEGLALLDAEEIIAMMAGNDDGRG